MQAIPSIPAGKDVATPTSVGGNAIPAKAFPAILKAHLSNALQSKIVADTRAPGVALVPVPVVSIPDGAQPPADENSSATIDAARPVASQEHVSTAPIVENVPSVQAVYECEAPQSTFQKSVTLPVVESDKATHAKLQSKGKHDVKDNSEESAKTPDAVPANVSAFVVIPQTVPQKPGPAPHGKSPQTISAVKPARVAGMEASFSKQTSIAKASVVETVSVSGEQTFAPADGGVSPQVGPHSNFVSFPHVVPVLRQHDAAPSPAIASAVQALDRSPMATSLPVTHVVFGGDQQRGIEVSIPDDVLGQIHLRAVADKDGKIHATVSTENLNTHELVAGAATHITNFLETERVRLDSLTVAHTPESAAFDTQHQQDGQHSSSQQNRGNQNEHEGDAAEAFSPGSIKTFPKPIAGVLPWQRDSNSASISLRA